jgi:hypothetical protein
LPCCKSCCSSVITVIVTYVMSVSLTSIFPPPSYLHYSLSTFVPVFLSSLLSIFHPVSNLYYSAASTSIAAVQSIEGTAVEAPGMLLGRMAFTDSRVDTDHILLDTVPQLTHASKSSYSRQNLTTRHLCSLGFEGSITGGRGVNSRYHRYHLMSLFLCFVCVCVYVFVSLLNPHCYGYWGSFHRIDVTCNCKWYSLNISSHLVSSHSNRYLCLPSNISINKHSLQNGQQTP